MALTQQQLSEAIDVISSSPEARKQLRDHIDSIDKREGSNPSQLDAAKATKSQQEIAAAAKFPWVRMPAR